MSLKNVLYAILSALIPLGFSALTGKYPDFPLDLASFGASILWIVGLLVGGWQFNTAMNFKVLQAGRRALNLE